MTHADLVRRAVRWLRNTKGCSVIVTRASINTTENPDALGWTGLGQSLLVECKVSRGDFFRDQKKFFRANPDRGVGNLRWYLTPPGLVRPDEVPEGWGLLECRLAFLRTRKEAPWQNEKNRAEEIRILLARITRGPETAYFPLEPGSLPDVGL